MKILILTLLFIPFLSFAQEDVSTQLSKKDRESIDRYALDMCDCINNVMMELHPKTIDIILSLAENGQEGMVEKIQEFAEEMDSEERLFFLSSLEKMNSPEFLSKTEECDHSSTLLDEKLKADIDSAEGAAHEYLMTLVMSEEACKLVKSLIQIGGSTEE